jgi:hypothetical protein
MDCNRPCYTQPQFDYSGMACFLKENMKHYDTGMQVIVMIKDKNQGKYRYVKKRVMYFVPNDPKNSSTVIAYVAPGHDNDYNYMYLLSRRLFGDNNVFSGDHFTMGLRNNNQFDLHYTTYDYEYGSKPVYLYYDLFIDSDTSPSNITEVVCSTRIGKNKKSYDNTLSERCYFFDNLMKHVHNNSYCNNQFPSMFLTKSSLMTGGKKKRSNHKSKHSNIQNKQSGGDESNAENKIMEVVNIDDVEEPFRKLIQKLESKIGYISNLESIEMHIMNNNKGIVTYCLDDAQVQSMHISKNGVEEKEGHFMKYYSLPFDFKTFEFISIETLVENISSSIKVKKNELRVGLDNLLLCDNENLDYNTIINMSAIPKSQFKTCKNTRISNNTVLPVRIPVSAGGKNKKIDKIHKSKDLPPFKFA